MKLFTKDGMNDWCLKYWATIGEDNSSGKRNIETADDDARRKTLFLYLMGKAASS